MEYSFSSRAFTSSREVHGNQIPDDYVDAEETVVPAGSGPAEISLLLNKPKPKR